MRLLFFLLSLFSVKHSHAQVNSPEKAFAFKITSYRVPLKDSATVVQVIKPESFPVMIRDKQEAVLFHAYKQGTKLDTAVIGWGRCQLIKGEYYYFGIHHARSNPPAEGDLLYVKVKLPVVYQGVLLDIICHAIDFTDVYDQPFMNRNAVFSHSRQAELAILDTMVKDIRFTANAMKEQMAEQNKAIASGMYEGKKLFDAMGAISVRDLELFLKYVIARPKNYAGNAWKISETFATWMNEGAPTVIEH